ncbi:MAG: phenylacetic acid degradation protein PaaN [Rhodocyclaceae bacterium]|nr:phenylacetic acid degradation protein PaaN [Rhodocyclaceae bacterium]
MTHPLFTKHEARLNQALDAIARRGYWSPFAESPSPKVYGEGAPEAGKAAFDALLNAPFELIQAGTVMPMNWDLRIGGERSPYGFDLGVTYPRSDLDQLFPAIEAARRDWRKAGPQTWAGVCMEILERLNKKSFEIAHAVMHTTGQAFMMAFQAGGPHAQDRGMEAVAYAWDELRRIPASADWEKPQGKNDPLRMKKHYTVMPRGIGLVIGCCTFPTWNGYPGLFASLATGNAVVVKPHPGAILPLAITVKVAREVLEEAGFNPDVVTLVTHETGDDTAKKLALRPEVKLIDFTGSNVNGDWLEANARQAQVFTEKAGVNQIIIDSTDDFKGLVRNVAFSLCLYSAQMCTAPQNLYIPKDGIETAEGHLSFDQVTAAIGEAIAKLLGDPARAVEVLGAIQNDGVEARLDAASSLGEVVLASRKIDHPQFPEARVRTPLLLKLSAADKAKYGQECFGPVAFAIATASTAESLAIARDMAGKHGALTLSVYTRDAAVKKEAIEVAEESFVALSINLTGGVFVNQSAAFSDYHGTGGNPAANCALTDAAFVARRFCVVQHREHI